MKNNVLKSLLGIACLLFLGTACVDKDGESDLNPKYPDTEIDDNGKGDDTDPEPKPGEKTFPNFIGGGSVAFPDAEGFGKNATGARSSEKPEIYHVTKLSGSDEGSFIDAVSKENRVIVFDVAGVIDLGKKTVVLKSNQTILGQTAPGNGVVLFNGRLSSSGAKNLIVRYLRQRMGKAMGEGIDAAGAASGQNQIYDHCSFTWGTDENFSLSRDGKNGGLYNITVQNSIIGQGLQNHSCGGLLQTNIDEGITIYRNLYIDNKTRNPKVKGLNQFVNNVVYNWGSGSCYDMGGDSAGDSDATIENNYFIVGPVVNWQNQEVSPGVYEALLTPMNPSKPITGGGGSGEFRAYVVGNHYDSNKNGTLDGVEITQLNWTTYCSGTPTFLGSRPALIQANGTISNVSSAPNAYQWIVENVGPVLPARDKVDQFLIEELTSLGTKGTILQDERKAVQYANQDWKSFYTAAGATKPKDSDGDGIPDEFEDKWGLNKNDKEDAVAIAKNGYMNIENYVLSLEYPEKYQ